MSARHIPVPHPEKQPHAKMDSHHFHMLLLPYVPRPLSMENHQPQCTSQPVSCSHLHVLTSSGTILHAMAAHVQQPAPWTSASHLWGFTDPYEFGPGTLEGFQWRGKISVAYPNCVRCIAESSHTLAYPRSRQELEWQSTGVKQHSKAWGNSGQKKDIFMLEWQFLNKERIDSTCEWFCWHKADFFTCMDFEDSLF